MSIDVDVDQQNVPALLSIVSLPHFDTVGEPQYAAKAAKREVRVLASGFPSDQARTRTKLIVVAMIKCCKWVFSIPR